MKKENEEKIIKYLRSLISRCMLAIILFLILAIASKSNKMYKDIIFNEELSYNNSSKYHDGVKLEVDNNYLVPTIEEGMIIFIGEKENYGNVVIIEDIDGKDIWYGNMETTTVKLYDYVEKNSYLGTTKNNTLYLAFQKDGKFLNYEEYLK